MVFFGCQFIKWLAALGLCLCPMRVWGMLRWNLDIWLEDSPPNAEIYRKITVPKRNISKFHVQFTSLAVPAACQNGTKNLILHCTGHTSANSVHYIFLYWPWAKNGFYYTSFNDFFKKWFFDRRKLYKIQM